MAPLSPARLAGNVGEVRERIAAAAARAGRRPEEVALLAAVKYVAAADLGALADAGIELVGENRAQDLVEKVALHGPRFRWHFIGQLQSRKVKLIAPRVELIHSVASASALRELARHATPGLAVLIEVNVAGEAGKAGVAPDDLDAMIDACPVPVVGLMTMPPAAPGEGKADASPGRAPAGARGPGGRREEGRGGSRRWFAALRELAAARGLPELSMGTSQDFEVAVEEGATIVRIGSSLLR